MPAALSFAEAHPAGFCDVSYISHNGQTYMTTCGADGKLHFRSAETPAEISKTVVVANDNGESKPLTRVAASPNGDRISVGDEHNFVKVYSFPSGELHTVATRFELPPCALAYSPSGVHLAASGDDQGIKLVDTASNKVFRQLPSEPYTRGLAYDPESSYLASVSAEGTLTVWDFQTGKAAVTKKKLCAKADRLAPVRLVPAWHPDGGALLAVPAQDGSILLLERLSWEITEELSGGHSSAAHVLAFSRNGLYLASTAADSTLVIWDVNEKKVLEKKVLPGVACAIAWHPTANELAVTTEDGQLAVWHGPISKDLPGPTADVDVLAGLKKKTQGKHGAAGGLIDDHALGSDAEGGSDIDGMVDLEDEEDGYDKEDSFLDASPRFKGARRSRAYTNHRRGRGNVMAFDTEGYDPLAALPQPQGPVLPGSTQLDAGRRYLSYTSHGCITLRSEGDHNVVEVAFHDTSRVRRRVPLLTDFFGFTMGALGDAGALYAAPSSADAPSTVVYRPFESWAPNSDWSFGLPAGEEAECVAAGTTFVAVATSTRQLRILSQAGAQRAILSLDGAVVALAARGGSLAVVTHAGPPTVSGDQCLALTAYDVEDRRMTQETRLALSPNATLTWLGYSEEGMLATYDSAGILRVLSPEFGGSWVPCFASSAERKGSESFWVFALSIAASEVQCIVCANGPEPAVPTGSARPVVTAAPMRLPVVTSAEEAAAPLEADVMRWGALAAHAIQSATEPCSAVNPEENAAALEATLRKAQVEADRASVKLFAKLVAADRQARALEVAAGLHTEAAFEGARRIAQHHRLGPLAEQVEALMQRKAEVDAEAAMAAREPLMQMNNGGYMQEEHQYQDQNRHREQDELDGVQPSVIAATPALDEAQQQHQQQQQTHALFGKRRANAGVDEQFREENGSPNAAVMNGALGAGNGATRNEGGAKRKAGVVGNPFARKKQAATKKKQ